LRDIQMNWTTCRARTVSSKWPGRTQGVITADL